MEDYTKVHHGETKLPVGSRMKYVWTLNQFSVHQKVDCGTVKSPILSNGERNEFQWIVEAFFNCGNLYIKMYLYSWHPCNAKSIQTKFCIPSINGKEDDMKTFTQCFNVSAGSTPTCITHSDLRDYISSSDTVIIICEGTVFGIPDTTLKRIIDVPACRQRENLGLLFDSGKFSDITFLISGCRIPAHKSIIAAASTVFAAMFEHDLAERRSNSVEIKDINFEVFKELLRFVYTGSSKKLKEMALDLHAAADKYDLGRLKALCEQEMFENITVQNVAVTLTTADRHRADLVKEAAMRFIIDNLKNVIKTDGYKTIAKERPDLIADIFTNSVLKKA